MLSEPHVCPFCRQDTATMFCSVCHATICNRDSHKHLACGSLHPIETVIRSITCQINYLEIMLALLQHTAGESPSQSVMSTMADCKSFLHSLQHISRHKLKQGHIQQIFSSFKEIKKVSENLE